MKVLFDTSVLVPALVASHQFHSRAIHWVEAAHKRQITSLMAWHAAAETWSVLTRLPLSPPISGVLAEQLTHRLTISIPPLGISGALYRKALKRCAERGVRSGAVFDALHLVVAEHAQADVLLTFNPSDFQRLAVSDGPRVVVPPDPPGITLP